MDTNKKKPVFSFVIVIDIILNFFSFLKQFPSNFTSPKTTAPFRAYTFQKMCIIHHSGRIFCFKVELKYFFYLKGQKLLK